MDINCGKIILNPAPNNVHLWFKKSPGNKKAQPFGITPL
jgi:hypothetical protein